MIELSVEGSIKFDPEEEDLEGRVEELLEDGEMDPDEARREALATILYENIGHTGFEVDDWHEV